MGCVANITHDRFPTQACRIGQRVKVVFHYDTDHHLMGTIRRDDAEHPWETIIELDNGRLVRAAECQYQPVPHG